MTPEQEVARKKRIVSAARALLSLEFGFVYGARRIRNLLRQLGDNVPDEFPIFGRFLDEIPLATPLGELRLLCSQNLLFSSDEIIESVERKFRRGLLLGCLEVIQAYNNAGK